MNKTRFRFGDIYIVEFGAGIGCEQNGRRPAIIFQNNTGNAHSPNVIVLPITSSLKNMHLPTHVFLPADVVGLVKDSVVLCENMVCISKDRIVRFVAKVPECYMRDIAIASVLATSAISYIDIDTLAEVVRECKKLNEVA